MRTFICCLSLLAWGWLSHASAQTLIQKSIPLKEVKNIYLDFEYAQVAIRTWDKNEVQITGSVNVYDNLENDKFSLDVKKIGEQLKITSTIKDLDEVEAFIRQAKAENVHQNCCEKCKVICSSDSRIKVDLEIKIPAQLALVVRSKYGAVDLDVLKVISLEIESIYGEVDVRLAENSVEQSIRLESKYNTVDLSLPASFQAEVELQSTYGEIFTNLELEVKKVAELKTQPIRGLLNGGGQKIWVKAQYNNIYLRATE